MSNTTTSKVNADVIDGEVIEGTIVGDGEIATGKEAKADKKAKGFDPNKDWSYLLDKDPSDAQATYAATMSKLSGVQITPKQFQVMISMHRWVQQSEVNKARPDYRGRTMESVLKGYETLAGRVDDRITNGEAPSEALTKRVNAVGDDVKAEVAKAITAKPSTPAKAAPVKGEATVVVETPAAPKPRQRRAPAKKAEATATK